ncbi:nuclear transport factor 2 family protein [Novosphingobium sp.]|uniref:nuclear transport factor 2 family protein n=1 Tax=Novosphingobium sp. TaxID=1874826 RepID=UPI0035B1DC77
MITARDLSIASLEAVKARQREAWLDLFAEDAVVEDPVGPSPFDPAGQGHRGRAAIAQFYDTVVARNTSFDYKIREWFACGDEVASAATFTIGSPDGGTNSIDLITIHKADAAGKICSLRAFWSLST